jgi:hypothetical protein
MSNENMHTPGPWYAITSSDGGYTIETSPNRNEAVILCARNPWQGRELEMHANAHVIAASPKLLSFVQMVSNTLVENFQPEEMESVVRGLQQEARELYREVVPLVRCENCGGKGWVDIYTGRGEHGDHEREPCLDCRAMLDSGSVH